MEQIIIWNNNSFSKLLAEMFNNSVTVNKYEDLKLKLSLKSYNYIVILCELEKNEKNDPVKLQELYGIELAKQLRRDNVKTPIIFTSFFNRKQVYDNNLDRGIINSIGHSFVQLPFSADQVANEALRLNVLNDLELYDIINNYCSLTGVIKMLLHALNGLLSNNIELKEEKAVIRKKITNAIIQLHRLFNKSHDTAVKQFNLAFKTLTKDNLNESLRFVEDTANNLLETFVPSDEQGTLVKAVGGWSMLLLDDEISVSHPLVKRLEERNLKVHCAKTAAEAESYLTTKEKIVLVVSDYRLEMEEDGLMIHQPVQGYQFLKQLSDERPGYIRLAALSSLPRKFLMQSFRHYGIRVEIFSKKDYLENPSTLEILCDELVDLGNENNEAIVRLPRITSENWEYFEPYYRHHRNSFNYLSSENYISKRSKEYCEGVLKNEYPFNLDGYTALNFDAKKAAINDGSGPLINEKYYKLFLEKCICRRVAIWYTQENPDWQLPDVLRIIKGRKYSGEEKETTAKNQINFNLALSLAEYPWNMTQEEKHWLLYQMNNREIEMIEKQEADLLLQCFIVIENWLDENYLNGKLLKNEDFITFYSEGLPRYGANFKIFRSFLHHLYLLILDNSKLIRSLQSELVILNQNLPTVRVSANSALFENYLEFFRKKLSSTKSPAKDDKLSIESWETFLQEIAGKVIKQIPAYQHPIFRGTAYEFYNNHKDVSYTNVSQRVQALFDFHQEQIKEWSTQGVREYDERKIMKKRRDNSADDF